MRFLAKIMPILPLSFVMLLASLEIEVIEEELDMDLDKPYNYEDDDYEEEDRYLKVAIVEDKAYWVVNNIFYEAEVIDDEILKEDAKPVDAFDMDFKEVTKMMIILDSIQDWKN